MIASETLRNYVRGEWAAVEAVGELPVRNPATGDVIVSTPLSSAADIGKAVAAAASAFEGWRRTPPGERIQPLFKLKALLDGHRLEIARLITAECGKTLTEAEAELQRGIENVEVATGIPSMMLGSYLEDIAPGIDEVMIQQPVGVVGIITPFNFPAMIPLWTAIRPGTRTLYSLWCRPEGPYSGPRRAERAKETTRTRQGLTSGRDIKGRALVGFLPYAVACGNTVVLKPSEKTPSTIVRIVELIEQAGLPPGVVNVVHGGKDAVDALLDHPDVRAISFVGSTPVARYIYGRAAANGKRVQCQGGAKNPVVVLPDADMDMTTRIVADSAFGCAGQRCLASSVAITIDEAARPFTERISEAAAARRVGYGLDEGVDMGPVISRDSLHRIEGLVAGALDAGANAVVDGRHTRVPGYERGNFIRPTVLSDVDPASELARTEVFGPVLSVMRAQTIEAAIDLVNRSAYGNMACLFTTNGASARQFRYETRVGNVGINVGVAAPMAYFPFSGRKDSFFGDLHAQGRDAIDFYTEKKVAVERWPATWSRKF